MIPKLLEKWRGKCNPQIMYHTLGFKTKSAAKRFLRAKGAKLTLDFLACGWYRYTDGRDARLFKSCENPKYPWIIHEVQLGTHPIVTD